MFLFRDMPAGVNISTRNQGLDEINSRISPRLPIGHLSTLEREGESIIWFLLLHNIERSIYAGKRGDKMVKTSLCRECFLGGPRMMSSGTLFAKYGEVLGCRIITERATGRSRGYGFVMVNDEDAERIMEKT